MGKRSWSVALAAALVAGVLFALPARAQQVPVVPPEPNITDPAADANGHSSLTGTGGGAYVGAADFLAVWFTHDAANLYLHIHTSSPSFSYGSIWYSVYVDPGVGADCMEFRGYSAHELVSASGRFILSGDCGSGTETVEFVTQEGPEIEGAPSGIHTLTVPRNLSEHLADGKTLSTPNALDRYYLATDTTGGGGLGILDDTEEGTPYEISAASGGSNEKVGEEPPGKNDPPGKGKKKGCAKGKGKKKGACPKKKKPKPAACPAYTPGEEGAEAETTIVTDAATEDAPIELEFEAPPGAGNDLGLGQYDGTESIYQNIQVDSAAPDTGLYVRYEFADRHDYDLYLNYPDGSTAANSGDFNVAPGEDLGGGSPEGGWEAGTNYEQVMGIRTADCAGYTARLVSFLTTGGATKLKIWLGPVVADPEPPGGEGLASAADIFFRSLRLTNPLSK